MNFIEPVFMAMGSLWSNKLRSSLTLLGVIIGVFTIVGMQSVIVGFRQDMHKQISVLGSDVFQVQKFPAMHMGRHDRRKYENRKDITWEQGKAIRKFASHVAAVGVEGWSRGQLLKYHDKKTHANMMIAGGTPEFALANGYYIQEGRFLTESDILHSRNVIVIGTDVAEALFPFSDPIGASIKLMGKPFQVIGLLEERGSRFGETRDNHSIIPLSTWQELYGTNHSMNITVRARSAEEYDSAVDEVTAIMRTVRKVPPGQPNDFEIFSSQSLTSQFDQMTKMVRFAAIGIASISLLVAGIGIMNIMLVTVTERTREIGIRKAIGAKRMDVLMQFLIESVILSLSGGIVGVIIGVGIAKLIAGATSLPAVIPGWSIVVALIFCSIIGLFFGLYPAAKASRLDPIESLRYE